MRSTFVEALVVSIGVLSLGLPLREEASASEGESLSASSNEDSERCRGGRNLLLNPGFEAGKKGQPEHWQTNAFLDAARFVWDRHEQYDGHRSVKVLIPLTQPNDARWIQTVNVKPNTTYVLSGWIKTKGVVGAYEILDVGANLSILDTTINGGFTYSSGLTGDHDWTLVNVSFNSDTNTTVTVAARLAACTLGEATGTASSGRCSAPPGSPCRR